jgi:peptide-methionine (S)-S-oxide reductase
MLIDRGRNRISSTLLLVGLLLAGGAFLLIARSHAERAHAIPAPVADEPTGGDATEVAVLAGGCFWGVQGVFQHVDGVTSAVSGAGGEPNTAQRDRQHRGDRSCGNRARQLRSASHQLGRILQIYSVAHDPTQLNRQGPDIGTQYHSTIFPVDRARPRSPAYITQLGETHALPPPS